MKKILIIIAIAIGSIVIGITAFVATSANASDSPELTPEVVTKVNTMTLKEKVAAAGSYLGMSEAEVESYIARAKKSCRAGYEVEANRELTKFEKTTCQDLEDIKLFDEK